MYLSNSDPTWRGFDAWLACSGETAAPRPLTRRGDGGAQSPAGGAGGGSGHPDRRRRDELPAPGRRWHGPAGVARGEGAGTRAPLEADALFENGDPQGKDFNPSAMDVTQRFLMECLRMYPIVPMVSKLTDFLKDGTGAGRRSLA